MLEVKITDSSFDALTKKQEIQLRDITGAEKIIDLITEANDNSLDISGEAIVGWAELEVHNEEVRKGNKDYYMFLLLMEDGRKLYTSSTRAAESAKDIITDMADAGEEYGLRFYFIPSKNYPESRGVLVCSVF